MIKTNSGRMIDVAMLVGSGGSTRRRSDADEGQEQGQLSVYDTLLANKRVPLVRLLFDYYCDAQQRPPTLDGKGLQQLCYDVGIYYSIMEVRVSIKQYASSSGGSTMNYDAFMVWWRSNSDLR